ncbi:hypothetical protein DFH09DRAFT_1245331 [Mycena vulgaris]|nr:hypothetical protein DFH09DRAFT_1245331 [Mycena vulgaris]
MAKAAKAKTRSPDGKQKKTATVAADTLKKKKAAIQDEFSNSAKTKTAYKGYLARGRAILEDIVADRRKKEQEDPMSTELAGIDTDLLAKAFNGPPNKHSVYALELYLTQNTAEGIHGAFVKYWDSMPGGKYNGEYSYDEETEKVHGNPGRAPDIQSFVKCIKTKARVKGAAVTRHHAEATTIEDMHMMMQWSESECTSQKLLGKPEHAADLLLMMKHGMMRAFLSTGYLLWTRNFETCQIQERDLSYGRGPSPYHLPFLGVFLDNRKGWQQKQGYDGPLESNHYQIYEQKDSADIDMFTHVLRWRTLYKRLLGRDFEPDDYLFPYISSNGMIHSKRPMTHDTAQDLIKEFTLAAKVNKIFTTHCLRRGGSQYRFMYAPIGKRWSLSIIRWWGGWAVGEHVDTLMRYLLDSLQSYESGHGDALYPFRTEPAKSFMGDHNSLQPPTTAEFRVLGEQILKKLETLSTATQPSISVIAAMLVHQSSSLSTLHISDSSVSTVLSSSSTSHQLSGVVAAPQIDTTPHFSSLPGRPSMTRDDLDRRLVPTSTVDASDTISVVPVAGAVIPGVGKDDGAWSPAINQWYHGDPVKGLVIRLKNWPTHWYTGSMRLKTGTLYSNRKLLAEEYER